MTANKPIVVTFTGVDQFTDLDAMQQLQGPIQQIEFGFLYSHDRNGKEVRYPAHEWLVETLDHLYDKKGEGLYLALHVCGREGVEQLWRGELDDLIACVERVQINGTLPFETVEEICTRYHDRTFITQHTAFNHSLLRIPGTNHDLLVDGSGGRGKVPAKWRRPLTSKHVGFAGGLGPHNLEQELPLISRASDSRAYWIDMESKIRKADPRVSMDQDVFDIEAVAKVLAKVEAA